MQRLIDANVFFEQYHYADCNIEMALEYAPTVLSLPNNPTNGDMIKAMYSPYKVCEHKYAVHIYLTVEDFIKADYQMNFDIDWWNAPYKGVEHESNHD